MALPFGLSLATSTLWQGLAVGSGSTASFSHLCPTLRKTTAGSALYFACLSTIQNEVPTAYSIASIMLLQYFFASILCYQVDYTDSKVLVTATKRQLEQTVNHACLGVNIHVVEARASWQARHGRHLHTGQIRKVERLTPKHALTVPHNGYKNPAPTEARTSRIGTTKPRGAPLRSALCEKERCVLAMQMGRSL
jgi:hypothetical protein